MAKKVCQKCGRAKEETAFYTYKNGEKTQLCKECLLMHVNIWQPDTFMWLIQKMDVPWVPDVWNSLREKAYVKNPNKKNDTTVFGKYLSQMKLKQFKQYGWQDTQKVQAERALVIKDKQEKEKIQQQIIQQQFDTGQISEAEYRTMTNAETQIKNDLKTGKSPFQQAVAAIPSSGSPNFGNLYDQNKYMAQDQIPDLALDLTDQDKKYLVMKWGRLYTPQEWIELETFYNEMMNSFDIQDADTRSTLILICKNNLKMNQAIDQGDLQGYQKLARVSDTLRKSAKFTAAQNKQQRSQFVDSVGQLVAYCQKNGGAIPKFDYKVDLDKVDKVIGDLKQYTRSLIYQDTALARQIQDYLKKREYIESHKQDLEEAKRMGLSNVQLTDEDLQKYNQTIAEQKEEDKLLRGQIIKEEEE